MCLRGGVTLLTATLTLTVTVTVTVGKVCDAQKTELLNRTAITWFSSIQFSIKCDCFFNLQGDQKQGSGKEKNNKNKNKKKQNKQNENNKANKKKETNNNNKQN